MANITNVVVTLDAADVTLRLVQTHDSGHVHYIVEHGNKDVLVQLYGTPEQLADIAHQLIRTLGDHMVSELTDAVRDALT